VGVLGMLASLSPNHDAAVIEVAQSALWMNRGPITRFLRPNVALITEIGISQIEMVKTLERAVRFKCMVFDGLVGDAIAVVGAHLPHFDQVLGYARKHAKSVLIYGDHVDSDIRIQNIESNYFGSQVALDTNRGSYSFSIPMPTAGMAKSAIAAFAIMYALGEDLDKACQNIGQYQSIEGRLLTHEVAVTGGKVTIIDDNWNALYESMVNALSLFGAQKEADKRFIFVLGRLVDLGEKTKEMHQSLSVPILESKPDLVITHGEEMKYLREVLPKDMLGEHFDSVADLANYIKSLWQPNDVILIKGSRTGSDFVGLSPLLQG
jgi:UDP-N-acetylmuramyl pentapeptide synthase